MKPGTAAGRATFIPVCQPHASKARRLGLRGQRDPDPSWLEQGCLEDLQNTQALGLIREFDVLILDESLRLARRALTPHARLLRAAPVCQRCSGALGHA
jgi:hypothetical protein